MIEVTFHSPAMAERVAPMGLIGAGTVDWSADGIELKGPMQSGAGASVIGCLGALLAFAVGIVLGVAIGLPVKVAGSVVLGLCVGGGCGGVVASRKLFPPKEQVVRLSWSELTPVTTDGLWLTFVSKGKPKGQVWFQTQVGSQQPDLIPQLFATANAAGASWGAGPKRP